MLGSGCGVLTSKIIRAGQVVWGTPARPIKEYLEQLASLGRLPELRDEVAELRRRLAELEGRPATLATGLRCQPAGRRAAPRPQRFRPSGTRSAG